MKKMLAILLLSGGLLSSCSHWSGGGCPHKKHRCGEYKKKGCWHKKKKSCGCWKKCKEECRKEWKKKEVK